LARLLRLFHGAGKPSDAADGVGGGLTHIIPLVITRLTGRIAACTGIASSSTTAAGVGYEGRGAGRRC